LAASIAAKSDAVKKAATSLQLCLSQSERSTLTAPVCQLTGSQSEDEIQPFDGVISHTPSKEEILLLFFLSSSGSPL